MRLDRFDATSFPSDVVDGIDQKEASWNRLVKWLHNRYESTNLSHLLILIDSIGLIRSIDAIGLVQLE